MTSEGDGIVMKCPQILALYLPQFHETKHNNEWWGEGYTEWTAVREAMPLFEDHCQPVVPQNNNYYNLLDEGTIQWQSNLARRYGVDGFVFYHYYFGEGRLELETPAECLLADKGISMPFCFCWANQSWVRSWSKYVGNAWNTYHECDVPKDENGILIEQKYGNEDEWERHFQYLLPFFKDERYIKHDGKPIFLFYRQDEISCLDEMIFYWRKRAEENGLPGLYLISMGKGEDSPNTDTGVQVITVQDYIRSSDSDVITKNGVTCIDYGRYCDFVAESLPKGHRNNILYTVCGYDTTPRKGDKGICLINRTSQKFRTHIETMLKKSIRYGNDYFIINAWNEWGEGMHLEPDETDGYAYLEAVRAARSKIESLDETEIRKVSSVDGINNNSSQLDGKSNGKFEKLYRVCSKLLDRLLDGEEALSRKLREYGVKSVAIYGVGNVGIKVYRILEREGIPVNYAIDRVAGDKAGLKVFRPGKDLPQADAIIITAYDDGRIKKEMQSMTGMKVFDIEELI
ncbi:MAG: glycoside hydrolase family 99-like domain-containing protein [Lachnospiraceae bacterium]|nr:glycoside hydrolase family 99-like domain-containing protein [Lachnospiraceae bacterium]